jgi:hypothetical protein
LSLRKTVSGFPAMKIRSSSLSFIACAMVGGLALTACGTVPAKAVPTDPAGNFSDVSPGIYRGGRPDQPGVQEALVKLGVKTIIDLENDDEMMAHGFNGIRLAMNHNFEEEAHRDD